MSSPGRAVMDTPRLTMRRNASSNDSATSLDHYSVERKDITQSIVESATCSQTSSTKASDTIQRTARPTMHSHAHKNGHNHSNKIGSAMLRALCDPHGVGQLPRSNVSGEKLGLGKGKKMDAAGQDTGRINFDEKLNELLSRAEPTDEDIDRFLEEAQDEESNQHRVPMATVPGVKAASSSSTSCSGKNIGPLSGDLCGKISGEPLSERTKAGLELNNCLSDGQTYLDCGKSEDGKGGSFSTQQTTVGTKTQEIIIHHSQSSSGQSRVGAQSVVGNHQKENIGDHSPLIARVLLFVISIYDTSFVQTLLLVVTGLLIYLQGLLQALSATLLPTDFSKHILAILEADISNERRTFKLFPKLPIEIRLMIWAYELPGARVVEIERGSDEKWYSPPGTPSLVCGLIYANRESRAVFLSHYKLLCGPRRPPRAPRMGSSPARWGGLLNFLSPEPQPRSSSVYFDAVKDNLYVGPNSQAFGSFSILDFRPAWSKPYMRIFGQSPVVRDTFQNLRSLACCWQDVWHLGRSKEESHERYLHSFPNLEVLICVVGDPWGRDGALFSRRRMGNIEITEDFSEVSDQYQFEMDRIQEIAGNLPWPIEIKTVTRGGRLISRYGP